MCIKCSKHQTLCTLRSRCGGGCAHHYAQDNHPKENLFASAPCICGNGPTHAGRCSGHCPFLDRGWCPVHRLPSSALGEPWTQPVSSMQPSSLAIIVHLCASAWPGFEKQARRLCGSSLARCGPCQVRVNRRRPDASFEITRKGGRKHKPRPRAMASKAFERCCDRGECYGRELV